MTHEFAVWAPRPRRVDLVLEDRVLLMDRDGRGWWRRAVEDAGPGTRYAFVLDGGPPRPDPRSPSQPDGIGGMSELVDHAAFAWRDHGWGGVSLPGAVLYELHVGTVTPAGTFDAVVDVLPHLVALGVDVVELMPVAQFSGDRGWGYDSVSLFAPHHAYGGPDGLRRLIDACHDRGVGVAVDVGYNHLGPAGNHLAEFGTYFSDRHQTNWGAAVNFDEPGSEEVRRFVIDNAVFWLRDYHADGLRLDAVHAIFDDSATHILGELTLEVDALATRLGRRLFVIAESDLNDPRFVRSRGDGGYGIDAAWADDWHHAVHAALTGERDGYYEDFGSVASLAKALRQAWVYDGTWSPHRRRHHGQPPTGLTGAQFVVSTQNHDQVGNRATGDRTAALMSEGRLRVAAALLLTGPFIPMLFQGEEWGASSPFLYFTDHRDPDLGRAVRDGRRDEFAQFAWEPEHVPDPQAIETFQRSQLDWDEVGRPPHDQLLEWYRRLVALRREVPALRDPRLSTVEVDYDEDRRCLVVRRGPVRVAANIGSTIVAFALGDHRTRVLAASDPGVRVVGTSLRVPPDAVAVVELASRMGAPFEASADDLGVDQEGDEAIGVPTLEL